MPSGGDPFDAEHGPAARSTPAARERRPAKQDPWTLREGVFAVLAFLGKRAPVAAIVWLALAAILAFFCGFGSVAGELSDFTLLMAFVALVAGAPVGAVFGSGLSDAVDFAGWIPWSLAVAASAAVVAGGVALVNTVLPFGSAFLAALVASMASIGAAAAVTKRTWVED